MTKLIGRSGRSGSRRSYGLFLVSVVLLLLPIIFVSSTAASQEHGSKSVVTAEHDGERGDGRESGVSREETENVQGHGNDTGHGGEHGGHGGHRYHVAKFDFSYVKIHFIVGIWILYAGSAKIFFHQAKWLSFFPESCMLILIGILLGLALYFDKNTDYELNTTTFFLVLLPPIILDAGYFMPARPFFDQLGTILLHAVMGTLLNTLWLGFSLWGVYEGGGFNKLTSPLLMLHALVFASLLAAVDPVAVIAVFEAIQVNEILYIVVFGESLLNDGISVVLYHVFEGFSEIGLENIQGIDIFAGFASFFVIVFGATGIGIVMGLFGGFLSRFTHHVRVMEPLMVYVIGYLSFLVAEMFHLSGILSCTFCGITMRKYVDANISPKSKATLKQLMKIAATCCEIIIFMYLGISAVSDTHHWDTAFCILTLIFCLIFRALGVVVLTYLANLIRVVKLTKIDQFIMAYGGLRGAIAFALVISLDKDLFPHRRMFITTTILVIYFTNLAMGTTIKPLVEFLRVKKADKRKPTMTEKITSRFMDHVMAGIEDVADQQGHHLLRERFAYFNNTYLKPIIVGAKNPQRRGWQIWSRFNRLNDKSAQQIIRHANSTASLSVLFRQAFEADTFSRSSSTAHLVGSPTSMNHSASGYADSWQWGTSVSSPAHDGRKPVKFDSIVGLDQQSHGTMDSNKSMEIINHLNQHTSEDTFRLQPMKDGRAAAAGREGQHSSTAVPRLYAPRRQPEYEPRSPVSENKPETPPPVGKSTETILSVNSLTQQGITFATKSCEEEKDSAVTVAESSLPWKRAFEPNESPVQSAVVRPPTSGKTGDHLPASIGLGHSYNVDPVGLLDVAVNVNQGYNLDSASESDSENNKKRTSKF